MTLRSTLSFFGALSLLFLSSCGQQKKLQETPPPEWVNSRPISSSYYIGIGSANTNMAPGEALRSAKERAAADLAGEIALRIESASLLETEERNGRIQEDFSSTITSRADERIAGFEVVDVWENASGCHVYYRLNKARHAAARKARQEEAIATALAELKSGDADLAQGQIPSALNHWGSGILALEEFWNEVNKGTYLGETLTLEPHLIRKMREVLRNIELVPAVNSVALEAANNFKFPLGIHATLDGMGAPSIPVQYSYHNGTYLKKATEFTDSEGIVVALIEGVAPDRPHVNFTASLDVKRLVKSAALTPVMLDLIGEINAPTFRIPLAVVLPSVFIQASPSSDLEPQQHDVLIQALRGSLLEAGFLMGASSLDSDFTISFNLRSERRTPSGDFGNFHTAYIAGSIALHNASGNLIRETALEKVKGVQLDPNAAMNLALSNAAEVVEKKHGPDLIRALR